MSWFVLGYRAGKKKGGRPAVIQSITITQNGKYDAPKGVDGFNPVIVNVPDRYDEGFKAGYTDGDNDGREAQKKICDEEKVILIEEIDRQDKEIEELKDKQGYTFPEGTSYEDIYQFVGDDTVTDKTLGYSVRTDFRSWAEPDGRIITWAKIRIVDSDSNIIDTIGGWDYAPYHYIDNIQIFTDGNFIINISRTDSGEHFTQTGYNRYLVGFGSSDHQINVQSN